MKFIIALSFVFALLACVFAQTTTSSVSSVTSVTATSATTVTSGGGAIGTNTTIENTGGEVTVSVTGTLVTGGAKDIAPALINLGAIAVAVAAYAAF